jgi:hypothetical protein
LQVQALLAASNASSESPPAGAGSYTAKEVAALMHLSDWDCPSRKVGVEYEPEPDEDLGKRVRALMDAWSTAYQLDNLFSDELANLMEGLPIPPHLDDCKDLENINRYDPGQLLDLRSFVTGQLLLLLVLLNKHTTLLG